MTKFTIRKYADLAKVSLIASIKSFDANFYKHQERFECNYFDDVAYIHGKPNNVSIFTDLVRDVHMYISYQIHSVVHSDPFAQLR